MLTNRTALIGLPLAVALTLVSVQTAGAATTAGASRAAGPAAAAPATCVVPDDLSRRAAVKVAPKDHYPHEAWLATGKGKPAVRAVGAVLNARFGTDTKRAPYTTLARGLIGTTVDHTTHEIVVVVDPARAPMADLRTALRTRLDAAGITAASGVGMRVQAGCQPTAKLLAAARTLAARKWAPTASRATFGFYVEPRDSTVHVTFGPGDSAAAAEARRQLGAALTVATGNPSRRDRLTDGEPHWGGAAIGSLNVRFCSAGFVIRRNSDGVRGGVTAGHCFDNGSSVYSGNQFWGGANGEAGFPTFDMIRVNSSTETYSNQLHVDPCCPSVRTVTGGADPSINELVCLSGYVTRAVCAIRITSLNGSLCDPSGCTPGLMVGSKPGATVGQGGDSGAPVYVRPGANTAHVRGIEIGGTAIDNFYGELLSNVTSHLGVTVATS